MAETKFKASAHLSTRKHLFTQENLALFTEFPKLVKRKVKRKEGLTELRRKIANAFEVPNEARGSLFELQEVVKEMGAILARYKIYTENNLFVGAHVTYEPLKDGQKVHTRILSVRDDYMVYVEGKKEALNPTHFDLSETN